MADAQSRLAVAERAELEARKQREEVERDKRSLELTITRRVDEERLKIREVTQKEEEESHRLKIAEKDKVIGDMRKQIEELRRKSEQGSQQLQGEVQEVELETLLKAAFPGDQIEPIQNGRSGGDVIQHVTGPNGLSCGTILWESKRTKNWSSDWLAKNREDQRAVDAQIGVIVTPAMPKGLDTFDRLEGVWVAAMRCALPLAKALRQALIETAMTKLATQGRDGKMERMYGYLIGSRFRQRVSAIVEAYLAMHEDLDAEKRAITKHWAKRERHLELLMTGAAGMYGDLQGIIGKSMPEVDGLSVPLLDGESVEDAEESTATATAVAH